MEELLKTAGIYYNSSSANLKQLAREFFKSLDFDNDAKSASMSSSGNGSLKFMEVMSLYYIIKSGRPFCEGCDEFIPGMFFTCSECFENGTNNPFCVCPMCFENERFIHPSHKSNLFLDNYTLLEAKRQSAMATRIAAEAKQLEAKREEELLATFATFPRQNQVINVVIENFTFRLFW
ncbi:hypothetical protein TEA_000806 [Camellia sinensis var. sinensis]|uniref:Uncharacterized protein n=1 Tax=Camellia sinensis var. sinensis TaxID=542762 RepID=A0A4S4DR73_CAMSN|nr:hypothetical protein TEA_000806 [Camellia sinensis var. sinensis]